MTERPDEPTAAYDRPAKNARRPILAALLELICSGLGHLYAGRLRWAIAWFAVSILGYVVMALLVFLVGLNVFTLLGWAFQTWVIKVAAVLSAVLVARKARSEYRLRAFNRWWVYLIWFVTVVASIQGAKAVLRTHVVEAYEFPSGSMLPTILVGDHFFVDKTVPPERLATRGAIVAFRFPASSARNYLADRPNSERPCIDKATLRDDRRFVKRIVATAGDVVTVRGGPYEVPAGHVFVMGDNRDNSLDSRCWGPVPVENLEGRVGGVWWSSAPDGVRWDRIGTMIE